MAFIYKNEGSVSGTLESINIHAGTNKFTIYPLAGQPRVVCHFPESKMAEAIDGINRHVCVTGTLRFRPKDLTPFEIDVQEIEVYPPDDELPSLNSLRGVAPNATGGIDSVAFVQKIRADGGTT